jgi:SPOR domain
LFSKCVEPNFLKRKMRTNYSVESVLERRISHFSPVKSFLALFAASVFALANVSAQTTRPDTTSHGAAASVGISITIVRDTTGVKLDSLSMSHDTSVVKKDTVAAKKDTLEIISSSSSYNTTPGFRVQLLTTQNLSEAIGMKARADSVLSNYNVYIVYDAPYYKVRVGDFHARYEANQAVAFIAGRGFPNAWSVPDNVFRNPPHKSN